MRFRFFPAHALFVPKNPGFSGDVIGTTTKKQVFKMLLFTDVYKAIVV